MTFPECHSGNWGRGICSKRLLLCKFLYVYFTYIYIYLWHDLPPFIYIYTYNPFNLKTPFWFENTILHESGFFFCLTTRAALDGNAPAVLLDWKSTRTPRVVRSTLAGEAYAADDPIDRGVFANQMFSQIVFGAEANPLTNLKTLKQCHATDCKCLYDAAIAANFNTEEKRVGLTIRAVQETILPSVMRWVPTTAMWAEKANAGLRAVFLDWLRSKWGQRYNSSLMTMVGI